jgi:hypothetical protein
MAEFQVADASLRRFNAAVTIIVCIAVVGLAYWCERAYRRWVEHQHPFAPRALALSARGPPTGLPGTGARWLPSWLGVSGADRRGSAAGPRRLLTRPWLLSWS